MFTFDGRGADDVMILVGSVLFCAVSQLFFLPSVRFAGTKELFSSSCLLVFYNIIVIFDLDFIKPTRALGLGV